MSRWLPFIFLLLAASAFAYAPAPTRVLPRTEFLAGNQRTPTYGDLGITQLDLGPDSSPLTVLQRAFDEYGRVTHFTNVNSVVTTNGFDLLDRLVLRHLVGGTNQVFQYTTRGLTNVTDELGQVTRYLNDALGRTTSLTNANNEGLGFAYNPLGQLLSLKDGKKQETKWNYNQYGQVTNKVDATGREIFRYGYDAAGQLTNRWSVEMGDTFYRYDNLGQLTNVDYPAGMADVTLQYDGLGWLTNAVDGLGTTRFGYNDAGQMEVEDGPLAYDTVTYTYANRRRIGLSLQQPSGTWTNGYRYDGYGRLTNVTSAAGSFGYVYDAQRPGLVAQILLPNGHVITQEHDALTRLTASTLVTSNGAVRNAHGYALNVGHQRTNQVFTNATLSLAGERMGYTYDNIGQLKTANGKLANGSAWGTNQWGYAYDAAWNLNTRTNNGTAEAFSVDKMNSRANQGMQDAKKI